MKQPNRKELIRAYKETRETGGVYAIKNTATGSNYIDCTANIESSRNRFDFAQKTNTCIHKRLEKEWKEYGWNAFVFEVLETLQREETQTAKQFSEELNTLCELWTEKLRG